MTNQELKVYKSVVKNITRENKKELAELIESTTYNIDELRVIVPPLFPSFKKIPKEEKVKLSGFKNAIDNIALAIYYTQNPEQTSRLDAYKEIIDVTVSAFKEERKARENLYNKAIKTNLTEEQYKHFQEIMHSYNYVSAAAFLRDVAINQLDVKPNNHDEFVSYFRETKKLANLLEDIADDLDDLNAQQNLSGIIKELIIALNNTRKLAIDSHSSATATSLARKHLSAKQLKALYLEKLEEEANL